MCNLYAKVWYDTLFIKDNLRVESRTLARKGKCNKKKKKSLTWEGYEKETQMFLIPEFFNILVIYYKILWKILELLFYFM